MTAGEAQAEATIPAVGHGERVPAAIVGLAQRALVGADLPPLMQEAAAVLAASLEVPFGALWEAEPDGASLGLRAGVGWRQGSVGQATVAASADNAVGYALLAERPMVVADVRREGRFAMPRLLAAHGVVSGLSVPVAGQDRPAILSAYSTEPRIYTHDDLRLAETVASILALASGRLRSEERLRQTAAQLRAIFRALPDLYFRMAADGTILAYEAGREADLYLPPPQFLGRRMQDVLPADVGERFREAIPKVLADGQVVTLEYSLPMPGGRRHYEARLVGLPGRELMAIVRNVTQRARAEEGQRFLAAAGRRLASSLDLDATLREVPLLAIPFLADWSVVELLRDGEIRQAAVAHTDPEKEELAREIGRRYPLDPDAPPVAQVVRERQPVLRPDVDERFLRQVARNEEHLRMLRSLGIASLMAVPLMARERLLGALVFVRAEQGGAYDQADLALADEVSRRAALALDNAQLYRQAQEAIHARDDFMSLAAHELKTPITLLRGFAQVEIRALEQAEPPDRERAQRALRVIDQQSGRLSALVERILEVALLEAGRLQLALEVTDVAGLVRRVVANAQSQTPGHTLRLEAPPTLQARVDGVRLAQVLRSLIDNAVKFSWRGGPVEIGLWAPVPATWRLSVRDHGVGVPPELRARLFERFFRAHPSRQFAGLGLGLYVARRIVELHGGRIEAEFPPDGGTRITMTMPR